MIKNNNFILKICIFSFLTIVFLYSIFLFVLPFVLSSKFFVNNKQIKNNKIEIIGEDIKHIKKVLRKKIEDEITICDTENLQDYLCKIKKIEDEKIECEILEKIEETVEPKIKVTIFQGLPKADKMELIIQKSVELGVNDITPVEMNRSIVKFDNKDKEKKLQRWRKISEVASKQCGRNIIPNINEMINVKNICNLCPNYDIVLVAYENEKINKLKDEIKKIKNNPKKDIKIGVVIGPEGGIEEKEIELLKQSNARIITLGKRILRTETVALNILSILMYELED